MSDTPANAIRVEFTQERDTKNKIRFQENTPLVADQVCGVIYVTKKTLEALGRPEKIAITIEAVE